MLKPVYRSALIALLFSATAATAWAQPDPADVAENCISRLRAITQHTTENMQEITARTVNRVNELQEQGEQRRAELVAHRGISDIHTLADRSLALAQNTTHDCVQALHRLDARPALIQAVREAGGNAADRIHRAAHRSIAAIREALAD